MRTIGERAGLAWQNDRRFGFELDFDDWLNRGTTNTDAQALVNDALGDGPPANQCFTVTSNAPRRILTLQMWLGVWRRP